MRSPRPRAVTGLALLAGAALLFTAGCAAWRIGQSIELARLSEPLQQLPPNAVLRLLVVGDSTAVGTGADSASDSVAGLIANAYPRLLIENRAQDGARMADVVQQLDGAERFDIVLVQAGGNDVIRLTGSSTLQAGLASVVERAGARAAVVVLMPAGNVGNAPFFFPPLSWWMTQRSRHLHALVGEAAARNGALYVNLFHERDDDPFVREPGLNASDGLHPSSAGYRLWFEQLMAQADLARRLTPAAALPRN